MDSDFSLDFLRVVEQAAIACAHTMGQGDAHKADHAAVDAAAEEIDVATAIDRVEKVVDWQVRAVEHKWAGLRSFAPDRLPVYGFDPANPRFFWFAGQGGYGIQSSPALSRLAAALVRGDAPPTDIMDEGLVLGEISPGTAA